MNIEDEFVSFLGGAGVLAMLSDDTGSQILRSELMKSETFTAFRKVRQEDPGWIQSTAKHFQKDKNLSNVRSRLGELRAYSDLLLLPGYKVKSNSAKRGGADFSLENKHTKQKLKVEVYTQGPKPGCETPSVKTPTAKEPMVETVVTSLRSWITDRAGDTTQSRTIKNIAGAKKDAHQVDSNSPTYLYIDFQTLWGFGCEQSLPILSQRDLLTAGACWMAFYGRKGMPILENTRFGEPMSSLAKMSDEGFFFKSPTNQFAGALLRSERKGENPLVFLMNPTRPTAGEFIVALMQSGLLNVEKSCWDFDGVQAQVDCLNKKVKDVVSEFERIQEEMQKQ